MKNKTKIMLGLSLLTAGTLAAGATGTFAWFTTNKTAKATYSNILAVGTQGDLKASITGVTNTAAKTTDFSSDAKVDANSQSYISDVSSKDGLNFIQPDWVNEAGNDKPINKTVDVSSKKGYFTQYLITLKNDKKTDNDSIDTSAIEVSLSSVTITSSASGTVNWIRVAIFSNDTTDVTSDDGFLISNSTLKAVYVNELVNGATGDNNTKYASASTGAADKLTLNDAGVVAVGSLKDSKLKLVSSLAAKGTRAIGVSVWLEGTASDNQDNIKNETVSVALEFTAKTVENN